MKEWEYHEEKIREIRTDNLAMNPLRELVSCGDVVCNKCLFQKKAKEKGINCQDVLTEWLYQEHKESYKLSRLEHYLLQYLNDCKIIEISRSRYGVIRFATEQGVYQKSILLSNLFMFIKDNSSRKIKDILENCEVIEDEIE
jgi:hypothetical protein